MKIVKTFYANDGKKFDDEFECRKYEQMLMEKVKKRKEKEQHTNEQHETDNYIYITQ